MPKDGNNERRTVLQMVHPVIPQRPHYFKWQSWPWVLQTIWSS